MPIGRADRGAGERSSQRSPSRCGGGTVIEAIYDEGISALGHSHGRPGTLSRVEIGPIRRSGRDLNQIVLGAVVFRGDASLCIALGSVFLMALVSTTAVATDSEASLQTLLRRKPCRLSLLRKRQPAEAAPRAVPP